ncbi:MAG TPA: hypothetical protein V6C65_26640, partial [Allocoleopsis sp.]
MSKFNYTQALLAGISGAAAATAISAVLSLSPLKNDDYVKAIGFAPATGGFGAAVGLLVYFCSVQINGVREEIQ